MSTLQLGLVVVGGLCVFAVALYSFLLKFCTEDYPYPEEDS